MEESLGFLKVFVESGKVGWEEWRGEIREEEG